MFDTDCAGLFCFKLHYLVPVFSMRIASLSDNTGAETCANKLYSSQMPLAAFSQRLALLSSYCGIFLDVTHIAGPKNEAADFLSRRDFFSFCERRHGIVWIGYLAAVCRGSSLV